MGTNSVRLHNDNKEFVELERVRRSLATSGETVNAILRDSKGLDELKARYAALLKRKHQECEELGALLGIRWRE